MELIYLLEKLSNFQVQTLCQNDCKQYFELICQTLPFNVNKFDIYYFYSNIVQSLGTTSLEQVPDVTMFRKLAKWLKPSENLTQTVIRDTKQTAKYNNTNVSGVVFFHPYITKNI